MCKTPLKTQCLECLRNSAKNQRQSFSRHHSRACLRRETCKNPLKTQCLECLRKSAKIGSSHFPGTILGLASAGKQTCKNPLKTQCLSGTKNLQKNGASGFSAPFSRLPEKGNVQKPFKNTMFGRYPHGALLGQPEKCKIVISRNLDRCR